MKGNYFNSMPKYFMKSFLLFFFLILPGIQMTKAEVKNNSDKLQTNRDTILVEMQQTLEKLFELWYPLSH